MKSFGGNWTVKKIEMIVDYAKAYLTIMNKYPQFKTLYFDGFAGSGNITNERKADRQTIKGGAIRILEIDVPKAFDMYYFVEMNEKDAEDLRSTVKTSFASRNVHVVSEDCNKKLVSMAEFLQRDSCWRVLAFIDPYGMSLNWSSVEVLKGLGIDLWILVPTGIGVGRLLKGDGKISDIWLNRLERFLGISRQEIMDKFYKRVSLQGLFDNELVTLQVKEANSITKIHNLYKERLSTVFKFVSDPFIMRNSKNSIMYHFMMATNNAAAFNISNDIVKPKYKL
jgi:three-Cys-motif partner protein